MTERELERRAQRRVVNGVLGPGHRAASASGRAYRAVQARPGGDVCTVRAFETTGTG